MVSSSNNLKINGYYNISLLLKTHAINSHHELHSRT